MSRPARNVHTYIHYSKCTSCIFVNQRSSTAQQTIEVAVPQQGLRDRKPEQPHVPISVARARLQCGSPLGRRVGAGLDWPSCVFDVALLLPKMHWSVWLYWYIFCTALYLRMSVCPVPPISATRSRSGPSADAGCCCKRPVYLSYWYKPLRSTAGRSSYPALCAARLNGSLIYAV